MFGGLFASLVGKIVAVVISIAGVTGGLAATGSLPLLNQSTGTPPAATLQTPVASANTAAGIPLSFPDIPTANDLVEAGGEQDLAISSAGQAIQAAGVAEETARQAAEAARKCIEQVTASVSALVAQVAGITTPEQAQALVTQAKVIAGNAQTCIKQAAALGKAGVDQASKAAAQANAAAKQLEGLTGATQAVVNAAQSAVGTATDKAGDANNSALGAFQQLGGLMDLMSKAIDEAARVNPGTVPVITPPVGSVPVPTTPVPNPTQIRSQWEQFAMDFAAKAMNEWSMEGFSGNRDVGTR